MIKRWLLAALFLTAVGGVAMPASAEEAATPAPALAQPPGAAAAPVAATAPAGPVATRTPPVSGEPNSSTPLPPAVAAAPSSAAAPPGPESTRTPEVLRLALPRDLSPWNMFWNADDIVKAVMIGLALASVLTWTVFLVKAFELIATSRRLRRAARVLDTASSLAEVAASPFIAGTARTMIDAVVGEAAVTLSDGATADGVRERAGSRLDRIEAAGARTLSRGTSILATIGATAPFIGLFGTVWGIMNSFIGISKAQTTNLAVVAPGIAEALLATAFGLVAAIPAVVIYNMFARASGGCRSQMADVSAAAMRLLSRELDRRSASPKLRVAAE